MSNNPEFTIDPVAFGKLLGTKSNNTSNSSHNNAHLKMSAEDHVFNKSARKDLYAHEQKMQSDRLNHEQDMMRYSNYYNNKHEAKMQREANEHEQVMASMISGIGFVGGQNSHHTENSLNNNLVSRMNHGNKKFNMNTSARDKYIKECVDYNVRKKVDRMIWCDNQRLEDLTRKETKKAAKKYDRKYKKHLKELSKKKYNKTIKKYEHEKYMLKQQNDHDMNLLDKLLRYDYTMQKKGKKPSSQVSKFYDNFYKRRHSTKIYVKK